MPTAYSGDEKFYHKNSPCGWLEMDPAHLSKKFGINTRTISNIIVIHEATYRSYI